MGATGDPGYQGPYHHRRGAGHLSLVIRDKVNPEVIGKSVSCDEQDTCMSWSELTGEWGQGPEPPAADGNPSGSAHLIRPPPMQSLSRALQAEPGGKTEASFTRSQLRGLHKAARGRLAGELSSFHFSTDRNPSLSPISLQVVTPQKPVLVYAAKTNYSAH